MHERIIRRAILGAIATAMPIGAGVVACGGTGGSDAGGDADNDAPCTTMCCDLPPPYEYTVTYDVCQVVTDASVDADDGAADASADAATSVCYTSCYQACQAMVPSNHPGAGSCVGDVDGGDGGVRVAQCEILQICGRRLDGLDEPSFEMGGSAPQAPERLRLESRSEDPRLSIDMIAQAAWLEAASIHAFRRLARELEAHGAPADLVRRARASARDEARHARMMARIARRRGASVPRVSVRDQPAVRDIESIAKENAVEGCVSETFGALFATWYAERASDPEIREAMAAIAPDELRHAALGWDVAAWAEAKLDAPARVRVREARQAAVASIVQKSARDPQTRALVGSMVSAGLWADA